MDDLLKKATENAVDEAEAAIPVDFDSLTEGSLLSMPQAAAVLNVPVDFVRELILAGYVPGQQAIKENPKIKYGDIISYLAFVRVPAEDEENSEE